MSSIEHICDQKLKRCIITWKYLLGQGSEFDSEFEEHQLSQKDIQWIVENSNSIMEIISQTYFHMVSFAPYPESLRSWYQPPSQSDKNNSYYEQIRHLSELKMVFVMLDRQSFVEACQHKIDTIQGQIKRDPSEVLTWVRPQTQHTIDFKLFKSELIELPDGTKELLWTVKKSDLPATIETYFQ
jgi:hypothetical protein